VLEAVLRRCVLDEPLVTFREDTEVTGLLTTGTATPTVTGVATTTGGIDADLVIDASGRASALLAWLRNAGGQPPAESAHRCGIVYFSRFYRLRHHPAATLNRGVASGTVGPSSLCVAIPGDRDTVSVTLGVPPGDSALRAVGREPAFTAAARLHPFVEPWLDPAVADPITEVAPMAGLQNRLRRFVVDGRPVVLGLLPVGDAACITDPAFGRGMSLALSHSFALADAIASAPDELHQLALVADKLTEDGLQPWFDDAVAQDRARAGLWNGAASPPVLSGRVTMAEVMAAAPHDQRVWAAAMRRFNLLDEPSALFSDQTLLDAVQNVNAAVRPLAPAGPSRGDLLGALNHRRPLATVVGAPTVASPSVTRAGPHVPERRLERRRATSLVGGTYARLQVTPARNSGLVRDPR
jgi:2-polyprenyl-6-methoxyphenol hydroxylase-like FAD-dependent oxidoreductase